MAVFCLVALFRHGTILCGESILPDVDATNQAADPGTILASADEFQIASSQSSRVLSDGRRIRKPKLINEGRAADIYDYDRELVPLAKSWPLPPQHVRALQHGAEARLTLRIVDSRGIPVKEAKINGTFLIGDVSGHKVEAVTDEEGVAVIEEKCTYEMLFHVSKDGYYMTTYRHYFSVPGFDCVKDGRWLPWDPVLEVVLKEVRNPEKMIIANKSLTFPKGQTVGFDFEVGDLLSPYGKGMSADISLWFEQSIQKTPYCYSNNIVVSACDGGSIATLQKDLFSQFKFAYEAPLEGWMQSAELGLVRTHDKILRDVSLKENEYWVVKTHDKFGNKRFGIISDFSFGGSDKGTNFCGVGISFIFNTSSSSRNLEFYNKQVYSRNTDDAEISATSSGFEVE